MDSVRDVQNLSRNLHKLGGCFYGIATEETRMIKLDNIHNTINARLYKMIKSDVPRSKELALLHNIVNSHTFGYLIALEYKIDDGGDQQHGDALFFSVIDTRYCITIVECKIIKPNNNSVRTIQARRRKVEEQAITCVRRLRSWILNHLCLFNTKLYFF